MLYRGCGAEAGKITKKTRRLSENAHLPFDRLMALSNIEGLR